MNTIAILGFVGATISNAAYVPQIYHLIKERCTAGLSKRVFGLWLVSSLLMLVNAIYISSPAFLFLTVTQTVATAIIFGFTWRCNGQVCRFHKLIQPTLEKLATSHRSSDTLS